MYNSVQEKRDNFRTILILRTCIGFAGAGILHPQPADFLKAVIAVGDPDCSECAIDSSVPARDQDWRLYEVYTDEEDPIKGVMMPAWAVVGAVVATGNPQLKIEDIEPEAWYGNLHAVLNNMPAGLATPEVFAMADQLIEWTKQCPPENLQLTKNAIKAKAEAIEAMKQGFRPPPTEERELNILVISL